MKTSRTIRSQTAGHLAPLGPGMTVRRVLPLPELPQVGPFIFLDQMGPLDRPAGPGRDAGGTGPHPHRGFITFTYLLDGEVEHADSRGNRGTVKAGGGQWMKAASGIVHDEKPSSAFRARGGRMHGFQFWINLPRSRKEDEPSYHRLDAEAVPLADLDGGRLRILIGTFEGRSSPLPAHTPQFLFHLRISPRRALELPLPVGQEAFVYLPAGSAKVAGHDLQGPRLARLDDEGDRVLLENPGDDELDLMIGGGEPLGEPVASYGPFVMNDADGIRRALSDFEAGKYGEIGAG